MTPARILIFDLDGTLVDTMGASADLFCDMLSREYGVLERVSRPTFNALMGKGPRAQFDAVLRAVESWDAARVDDITRRYWERDEANVPVLFPEVLEVLTDLRHAGHTLVVSSGSIPPSVEHKLRLTGIDRLFQVMLGSDEDVPALAKGSGHFAMIAAALSLTAADLQARGAFIGDGVYDMQVARAAGIIGIGRLTGDNAGALYAAGASHVIADLRDLRPLLPAI